MTAYMDEFIQAGGLRGEPYNVDDLDALEDGIALPGLFVSPSPTTARIVTPVSSTPGGGPITVGAVRPTIGRRGATALTAAQATSLLGQGIRQATTGQPADSKAGALVGAGLGGTDMGTGALPGALGEQAQDLLGQPGLPPVVAIAPVRPTGPMAQPMGYDGGLSTDPAYQALATHTERAGRAVVRRIIGATDPQLAEIRVALRRRAEQIRATSEHRAIMSHMAFQMLVLAHLHAIARSMGIPWAMGMPTGSPMIQSRRY